MTRAAEGPALPKAGPTTTESAVSEGSLDVESTAPVPQFDSPEWRALPITDPRKSQAVWIAARCWVAYWSTDAVADRLRAELDLLDRETLRRVREASYDLSTATDWDALAKEPTHAKLARRRNEVPSEPCRSECGRCSVCIRAAAVQRQGGDFPGRAVRGVA